MAAAIVASRFFILLFKNIFILKHCGVTLQQQQEQDSEYVNSTKVAAAIVAAFFSLCRFSVKPAKRRKICTLLNF